MELNTKTRPEPTRNPRKQVAFTTQSSAFGASASPRRLTFLACLLLAVLTLAAYARVKNNSFVNFDDPAYITHNSHVQAGLNWSTVRWALTSFDAANWHPLTWLSHLLDSTLFGMNPACHHLTSLVIHVLNVLLLFFFLMRVTGSTGRSFLVAALFALHPYNVESVAWLSERKNVLCLLFFLLTLCAYAWYAQKPKITRYLVVVITFALGLAAKPMVITLPFVLLLLDVWPLRRIQGWGAAAEDGRVKGRRRKQAAETANSTPPFVVRQAPFSHLIFEKLPLLLLSVVSAIVTILAQRTQGAIQALSNLPLNQRLENAVWSYGVYIWQAFWPTKLCVYYPNYDLAFWQVGLAAAFLVLVSVLVWSQRVARPYLLVGWLWYLGTLVPVIGIVQAGDQARADRYMYLPLIGIFVMVIWGIADWADRAKIRVPVRAAAATLVLAALFLLTWRQVGFWKSSYDLWSRAASVTTENFMAEANLADSLHRLRRPADAAPHFQRAAQLHPTDPMIHVYLAETLAESGRLQDSIAEYRAAVNLSSDPKIEAPSYESLAILYGAIGDYSKVQENYKQALEIAPAYEPFMIAHLSNSLKNNPTAGGYLSLGMLQQAAGHLQEARRAYDEALKRDPGFEQAKAELDALGSAR